MLIKFVDSLNCKNVVFETSESCTNTNCPVGRGDESPETETSFDLRVFLSDHSGSLVNCRLSGKNAEKVLNCTVSKLRIYEKYFLLKANVH